MGGHRRVYRVGSGQSRRRAVPDAEITSKRFCPPYSFTAPGHRRDVVLDEERVEDHQRQRADQRAGHQRAPAVDVAVDELVDDRDRHRLVLRRGDEGERVDELVPAQREAEDEGRDQPRHRERQDDLGQDLPAAGAVDQRAFLELERDGLEVAHQQPGRERDQDGRIGQDQRERRVEQAVLEDDGRQRDEQDRRRHQIGEEDRGADPAARRGSAAARWHRRRARWRRSTAPWRATATSIVFHSQQRIVGLEQQLVDVLERRRPGPERVELRPGRAAARPA